MARVRSAAWWLVALVATVSAAPPAQPLPPPSLDDFLAPPDFWSPRLSPSGRYLAGMRRIDRKEYVFSLDLDAGDPIPRLTALDELYVSWMEWASDDRLLVALTGLVDLRNGERITRQEHRDPRGHRRSIPAPFARIISIDRRTGDMVALLQGDRTVDKNLMLGRINNLLPDDPVHVLMPAMIWGELDLLRVNIVDGSFERIAEGTRRTVRWYTDRHGNPFYRLDVNWRATLAQLYARDPRGEGRFRWRKIRSVRLKDSEASALAAGSRVLFPGPAEHTYYVATRPEDEDFAGIYLYDLGKDEIAEPVYPGRGRDIWNAMFNPETQELMGVYYFDDALVTKMLDPSIQKHLDALKAVFGPRSSVMPLGTSVDGVRWLIEVSGPSLIPSFHLYDLESRQTRNLGPVQERLRDKAMGNTRIIHYRARDGLSLRGYLTRPRGAGDDNPPLVMLPHDGPDGRDTLVFQATVQILVAQGYQVFQPNFRGSAGFGESFEELGHGEWGQAMQTDLDDGHDHLVAAGLADPGEACIFGSGYGGYAALAAATLTPRRYRCIIASGAPSDLVEMLSRVRREAGASSAAYRRWVKLMGDPQRDRAALESVSPARLAARVTSPVLLLHGEKDQFVPFEQSENMLRALQSADVDADLVALKGSNHNWMPREDRLTFFSAVLDFLDGHLPAD